MGYIISGAKHSPMSSSVWGHHIVEIQDFDLDMFLEPIFQHLSPIDINGICVSKCRSNENSSIMIGFIW